MAEDNFIDVPQKIGIGLMIAGAVILVSGILTLALFLSNNPAPKEGADV
ncbi:MAG TPA: hypothetical protein VMC84_09745 [Methanocella sp.]|nr:hypothetical protein [Methanocella sp.]HTY91447.1 hypothetical protein [Methanocella sp.]